MDAGRHARGHILVAPRPGQPYASPTGAEGSGHVGTRNQGLGRRRASTLRRDRGCPARDRAGGSGVHLTDPVSRARGRIRPGRGHARRQDRRAVRLARRVRGECAGTVSQRRGDEERCLLGERGHSSPRGDVVRARGAASLRADLPRRVARARGLVAQPRLAGRLRGLGDRVGARSGGGRRRPRSRPGDRRVGADEPRAVARHAAAVPTGHGVAPALARGGRDRDAHLAGGGRLRDLRADPDDLVW